MKLFGRVGLEVVGKDMRSAYIAFRRITSEDVWAGKGLCSQSTFAEGIYFDLRQPFYNGASHCALSDWRYRRDVATRSNRVVSWWRTTKPEDAKTVINHIFHRDDI